MGKHDKKTGRGIEALACHIRLKALREALACCEPEKSRAEKDKLLNL